MDPATGTPPPPPGFSPMPPPPPGFAPMTSAPATSAPAGFTQINQPAPVQAPTPSLSDNPQGEGIYRMKGPDGRELGIPYSKAKTLGAPQGWTFADPHEAQRFMKDYAADPELQQSLTSMAQDDPALNLYLGAAKHALHFVLGAGERLTGDEQQRQSLRILQPTTPQPASGPSALKQFAEEPDQNLMQTIGGAGVEMPAFEAGAEGLTAENLLKYLPELGGAAKLKVASTIAKLAEDHPLIAHALKNAGVQAATSYTKTGDVGQAAKEGAEMGATSLAIGKGADVIGKGLEKAEQAAQARQAAKTAGEVTDQEIEQARQARATAIEQNKQNTEQYRQAKAAHKATVEAGQAAHEANVVAPARAAHEANVEAGKAAHAQQVTQSKAAHKATVEAGQAEASQTYSKTAGQAIEPHLRALEETGKRPITMAQPGGGPGVAAGFTRPINTDEILSRVGDYTGARDELRNALNQGADAIDEATGGRFKSLNAEVAAAQRRVYNTSGAADAVAEYQRKLGELDSLINSSKTVRPEFASAVRSGWRQYYVLGDVAGGIDKAVMGIPGDTAVSQAQRGLNGKVGMTELGKLVRTHGRPAVAEALGGEERLKTLESVFQKMATNAGRREVNKAILNVAKYMEHVEPYTPPAYTPPAPYKAPTFTAPEYQPPPAPTRPARIPVPTVPIKAKAPETPESVPSAIGQVARHVIRGVGAYAGHQAAGFVGATVGVATAEAALRAGPVITRRVQDAMLSNPQVAKNILYAVEKGADPKTYGPFIAAMIAKANQQQTPQEEPKP